MEEFDSYIKKNRQKDKAWKKQENKNIYIHRTMCNYKLYTITRLVPNKSIQEVQLIY